MTSEVFWRQTYGCLGPFLCPFAWFCEELTECRYVTEQLALTYKAMLTFCRAAECPYCYIYLSWLHGLSSLSPHWCCGADILQSLQLPYAWAWSAGTSYSVAHSTCGIKIRSELWDLHRDLINLSLSYLLELLSSSSQRSFATRNTDLRLIGRDMEWTRPSSTSSTSSWLLHKSTQISD